MQSFDILNMLAPLVLAFMIFGMGLSLKLEDFYRLVLQPKAVILGLSLQLLFLPLLGFLLNYFFDISGSLAVGMMILVACPGGPGSNLLSYICRGDAALSVTLTAFSSIFSLLSIPLLVSLSVELYLLDNTVSISVAKTISAVMIITIVPLLIGMFIYKRFPTFATRVEPKLKFASIIFLLVLVVSTFYKARNELAGLITVMGLPIVLLCVSSIVIAYIIAKSSRLNSAIQKTISIEVGIQNSALAIVIASSLLNSNEMAIPAALYSPVMITASLLFMLHTWFRQRQQAISV